MSSNNQHPAIEDCGGNKQCPLMGLRVGAKIEVYYAVHIQGCSKPNKLWLPAIVKSLRYVEDGRGATLNGAVSFPASEYFAASTTRVVFVGSDELRDEHGEVMDWRICWPTSPTEDEDGDLEDAEAGMLSSDNEYMETGEDQHDADFQPESVGTITARGVKRAKTGLQASPATQRMQLEEHRATDVKALKVRIAQLHKTLEEQRLDFVTLRTKMVSSHPAIRDRLPQPLLFLFHKLEKFLTSPPPRPTGVDVRNGLGMVKQEVFIVATDCTLSTFDMILHHAESEGVTNFLVNPSTEELKNSIPEKVTVTFPNLRSMLKVYGPLSKASLSYIMFSTRKERGSDTPICARLLGVVSPASTTDETPFFLSIGEHLQPLFPNNSVEGPNRRVLHRSTCEWNAIENYFRHPLSMLSIPQSDLVARLKASLAAGENDLTASPVTPGFGMIWDTIEPSRAHLELFQHKERAAILGTLRLTIPHVNVKSTQAVNEIARLLKNTQF